MTKDNPATRSISQCMAREEELIRALRLCITEPGAMAWEEYPYAHRRMRAINDIARSGLYPKDTPLVENWREKVANGHTYFSFHDWLQSQREEPTKEVTRPVISHPTGKVRTHAAPNEASVGVPDLLKTNADLLAALKEVVEVYDQPHYGDYDTRMYHAFEAVQVARNAIADANK